MRDRAIVRVRGKVRASVNVSITIRVRVKARVNVRLTTAKVQRRQCSAVHQNLRQLPGSVIADAVICKPQALCCVGELTFECIRTFTHVLTLNVNVKRTGSLTLNLTQIPTKAYS